LGTANSREKLLSSFPKILTVGLKKRQLIELILALVSLMNFGGIPW